MVRRNKKVISAIITPAQKGRAAPLLDALRDGRAAFQMRSALLGSLFAISGIMVAIAACSDDSARNCRVAADCASGVCGTDGNCRTAPVNTAPVGTGIPGDDDDTTPPDTHTPDDGGGASKPGCIANNDGTITRDEVPIQAGLHGTYRFADEVDISTAGTKVGDLTTWDLSAALSSDANVLIETSAPTGKWFSDEYSDATYVTPLGKDPSLLAVFKNSTGSLVLLGAVSVSDASATKTDLKNASVVRTLDFPLKVGKTWEDFTNVSGVSPVGTTPSGPVAYSDHYVNNVDAEGDLITPLGKFHSLRLRIELTRTIGAATLFTTRTYAFITECFGNVASIASELNEPQQEFTHASEIRRIAP